MTRKSIYSSVLGLKFSPFQLAVQKKDKLLIEMNGIVEDVLIFPKDVTYEQVQNHQHWFQDLKHIMSRDVMLHNNKYFNYNSDSYNFWAVTNCGNVELVEC